MLNVVIAIFYFAACSLADILGEVGSLNTSTQPQLEDMFIVAEDDLAKQMHQDQTKIVFTEPFPGYVKQEPPTCMGLCYNIQYIHVRVVVEIWPWSSRIGLN
jgi:hypothetical protein